MTGIVPSASLRRVPGFESTAYAYLNGELVWAGSNAVSDHPRNARNPWQPPLRVYNPARLKSGAAICQSLFDAPVRTRLPAKGLLLWLAGQPLPFPLFHARARFDAIRLALEADDLGAFERAALRVLGLGDGLTPSGDDFVGGIFFALAHAPRSEWSPLLVDSKARLRAAALTATNPISAALLDDLIDGCSHRGLHDLLDALQSGCAIKTEAAFLAMLRVGASSGADMLAGMLLALQTLHLEN